MENCNEFSLVVYGECPAVEQYGCFFADDKVFAHHAVRHEAQHASIARVVQKRPLCACVSGSTCIGPDCTRFCTLNGQHVFPGTGAYGAGRSSLHAHSRLRECFRRRYHVFCPAWFVCLFVVGFVLTPCSG